MVITARYLEAPQRLRAFVRAHETSLVILAALIGIVVGVVVLAMIVAVAALHSVLFDISIRERLSSQISIDLGARCWFRPSAGFCWGSRSSCWRASGRRARSIRSRPTLSMAAGCRFAAVSL